MQGNMLSVVVLSCVVAVVYGQDCSYWCRTPEDQLYCCADGPPKVFDPKPKVNPGKCPTIRGQCPQSLNDSRRPPNVCAHDGSCRTGQKCCYDRCLGHHTCKPVGWVTIG